MREGGGDPAIYWVWDAAVAAIIGLRLTIGTMAVKCAIQGLLARDEFLESKAIVLILLLEARFPASAGHAGHGALD